VTTCHGIRANIGATRPGRNRVDAIIVRRNHATARTAQASSFASICSRGCLPPTRASTTRKSPLPPLRRSQSSPIVRFSAASRPSAMHTCIRLREDALVSTQECSSTSANLPKNTRVWICMPSAIPPVPDGAAAATIERTFARGPSSAALRRFRAPPISPRAGEGVRAALALHRAASHVSSIVNVKPAMGRVATGLGGLLESEGSRHG
jgi:hypothetical protein